MNPLEQLAGWIEEAGGNTRVEAVAMCIATVGDGDRPSARMVLMRGINERGLRFYTSYGSRKAQELALHPNAAAVMFWPWLERQARIEGSVSMLSEAESDAYFESRPRGHRVAAWASEQSALIESYDLLEERFAHFDERFANEAVPRPHSWGGYLLTPRAIELWQGRPNRMHERVRYERDGHQWHSVLLQP